MLLPERDGVAHFWQILISVIYERDGAHHSIGVVGDAAEFVVEQPLNNVRSNLQLRKFGCERATQIVQCPAAHSVGHFGLVLAPTGHWPVVGPPRRKEQLTLL